MRIGFHGEGSLTFRFFLFLNSYKSIVFAAVARLNSVKKQIFAFFQFSQNLS